MRNILLILTAVVLIALTTFFLYKGCCGLRAEEGFEDAKKEETLTEEELALFEDLKADKYTAEEIDQMVVDGVIDPKLVEKFLDKLDTFDAVAQEEAAAKPEAKPAKPAPASKPAKK